MDYYSDINIAAVFIATVLAMGIGMVWYGPLFGKQWAALMGFDVNNPEVKKKMKESMKPGMIVSVLSWLVMAYILSFYINATGAMTISEGIKAGFMPWIGFVVTAIAINGVWSNKKPRLMAIDAGHFLVVMTVMGAVIAVMSAS